jgi:prepilin-type N-terminal cleavage/methylation domain-containing protein
MGFIPEDPRREGEAGFTLIELMVVMVISLVIGAAALMAIQTGQTSTAKTSARQEATIETEHALARMTREIRQATQAALPSMPAASSAIYLKTWVRSAGGGAATVQHVRYQCTNGTSGAGGTCSRTVCSTVPSLLLSSTCTGTPTVFLRGVDQFSFAAQLGGQPGSPTVAPPAEARQSSVTFNVVTLRARVRLNDRTSGRQSVTDLDPIEIQGGVRLESLGT